MKLTFILELLAFCALLAFAASASVPREARIISAYDLNARQEDNSILEIVDNTENPQTDTEDAIEEEIVSEPEQVNEVVEEAAVEVATEALVNVDDSPAINKYCTCSNAMCNCCRDFNLPFVPVRGPGCATIQYLQNDQLSVSVKYGDLVIANRRVKAGQSKPICIPFPGGFSSFCGRIYNVARVGEDFKACLGLELRASEEIEAALRVSCFKFGEKGLAVTDADPLPEIKPADDDDDDDDIFGLGGDDDDDDDDDDAADDDDDDILGLGGDDDDDDDETPAAADADDATDYTGFSLLGDIFGDDEEEAPAKKKPSRKIETARKNVTSDSNEIAAVSNTKITPPPEVTTSAPILLTTAKAKPIKAPVTKAPPKKKKPEESFLEALLSDDDDDEDETVVDKDETEDEEEDEEYKEEEEAVKDEEEEEEKDPEEEDEEEETEAEEEVEEDEDTKDETEDTTAESDSNAVTKKPTKKKKVKNDYGFGFFSRLLRFF